MLKLLHTADLHLGREFSQLDEDGRRTLARARLAVVEQILALADQYAVDAVLCAGDIFDTPDPSEDWWKGLAKRLTARNGWSRPIVLLPGNHDPLVEGSVFHPEHQFRQLLPPWVHVVDCDGFELALGPGAVVYAAPCRSTAGAEDLALSLPARSAGDLRIRIGLVHGSTFDLPGYQTNFPIARDATAQRGLDYLAVGDTHGYRVIPGRRRPTSSCARTRRFGVGSGSGVMVTSGGRRPLRCESGALDLAGQASPASKSCGVWQAYLSAAVSAPDMVPRRKKRNSRVDQPLKGTATSRAGAFILISRLRCSSTRRDIAKNAPETLLTWRPVAAPGHQTKRSGPQILYRLVSEASQ